MGAKSSVLTNDVAIDSRISTLETWKTTDAAYISDLLVRQGNVESNVVTQTGRANDLETTVNTMKSRNDVLANLWSAYDTNYAALDNSVTTTKSQLAELSRQLLDTDQMSARLSNVNSLVKQYDRANMLLSLGNFDVTVSNMSFRIMGVSTNVSNLGVSINTNTAALGAISGRISTTNLSYSGLETKFNTLNSGASAISARISNAMLSGYSYADATNQYMADQQALVVQKLQTLSDTIYTNAATANTTINAVSTTLSNTVMALSNYVKSLNDTVSGGLVTSPKVYTAPATLTGGYGLIVGNSAAGGTIIPNGSVIYSAQAKNVNIYNTGFQPGYTIYVVNYATTDTACVTAYGVVAGAVFTTLPIFYSSSGGKAPALTSAITIPAGKTATFEWTGDNTTGPWVVTFSA